MKANFISSGIFDGLDDDFKSTHPAGTAEWARGEDGKVSSILFICPCGCKKLRSVPIAPAPRGWTWNGDLVLPTLTPSILIIGECGWHGFLTNGEWRTC